LSLALSRQPTLSFDHLAPESALDFEEESVPLKEMDDEAQPIQRRTDHLEIQLIGLDLNLRRGCGSYQCSVPIIMIATFEP
jgi:hypothetical protein